MNFEEWVAALRAKTAALNQLADELDALAYAMPPVTPEPVVEEATGEGGGVSGGEGEADYVPAPAFPAFAFSAGPEPQDVAQAEAYIYWTLSEPGTGITRYGVNPSALTLFKTEARLLPMHRQKLASLVPNTTYYYTAESANAAGKLIKSAVKSFKTAAVVADQALAETFDEQADAPPTIRESAATFIGSLGKMMVAAENEGRVNFE
jgi:hypothetical protein